MKKVLIPILLVLLIWGINSCKKDPEINTEPERENNFVKYSYGQILDYGPEYQPLTMNYNDSTPIEFWRSETSYICPMEDTGTVWYQNPPEESSHVPENFFLSADMTFEGNNKMTQFGIPVNRSGWTIAPPYDKPFARDNPPSLFVTWIHPPTGKSLKINIVDASEGWTALWDDFYSQKQFIEFKGYGTVLKFFADTTVSADNFWASDSLIVIEVNGNDTTRYIDFNFEGKTFNNGVISVEITSKELEKKSGFLNLDPYYHKPKTSLLPDRN